MSDVIVGLADAKPAPVGSGAEGLVALEADERPRCSWGASTVDLAYYHDTEWGRPVTDERILYEKMCLEGFQSGLSWLTILRKRESFRAAFANFDAEKVAAFGADDVDRLLGDAGIVRHRGKIEAAISNARAMLELWESGDSLANLFWSYRPERVSTPREFGDIPAQTEGSKALSKQLKRRGFRFVGPTTAYAAMQAMGVVNDHLEQCWARTVCESPGQPTRQAE
ncbi:MAG: DNA-3-methyladenine glycosylase I [Actinomycetia bacterium]|nr:DNA-3-methyladenine glycosylase I [Actinomycetes bacterium]